MTICLRLLFLSFSDLGFFLKPVTEVEGQQPIVVNMIQLTSSFLLSIIVTSLAHVTKLVKEFH